ncbi:ABC transporter permease [Paenibacillus tritici]|uniref:ABC transporter permease n=1 Tax=Paenibacillus tritici TaxID=1873425 RepID=A0ABX2DXD7_9BACL|nr:ABC transporter permease [Paenibacillus tritici]NQX48481.1 ABC transporter permease [Paenibacillus tritici]
MIKLTHTKVLRNLSAKSFKANKARNLIAITAIALTSLLFTTLYTMGLGAVGHMQQAMMRQAGGDAHAVLKYISAGEFTVIKDHPLIKEIAYRQLLSDGVQNKEFLKWPTEFWYYDNKALNLGFVELDGGHQPAAANEVIADKHTLQLLGVPLTINAPVHLKLDIREKTVERNFILSGWWENDPMFHTGQIYASQAYLVAHTEEIQHTYKKDHSSTGTIHPYIMFNNSLDLRGKLNKVITESGYSLNESAVNFVQSNVNWAYLSTRLGNNSGLLFSLLLGLLLIVLTGYLIIYNIFQISVLKDIRFYGLLKTIGTTSGQVRSIIRRQALFLSVPSIPVGLAAGFMCGKYLVPLIIDNTVLKGTAATIYPNPWIFIGSALFTLITVFISTLKPARLAASVSPVDAVRIAELHYKNKKNQKNTSHHSMPRIARFNLGRNKKRTLLVIISLSLSLVLLNITFALSKSMDVDKYISSRFSDTDFLIGHADLFHQDFTGSANALSDSFVKAVQAQLGFEEGGYLYGDRELLTVENSSRKTEGKSDGVDAIGNPYTQVYGLDELPLRQLQWIDGQPDYGRLASGKYILEGVALNDNGTPYWPLIQYKVGDTVTLHNNTDNSTTELNKKYTTHTFTVLGHVAMKNSNSDRMPMNYNFYIPANIYKELVQQPTVMSYAFNVPSGKENAMESFLAHYTRTTEPLMDYQSKLSVRKEVAGMQQTVETIGVTLSLIISCIGILNFINTILASIIARRQEIAMLQSIGMTRLQLHSMLALEGIYYVLGTGLVSGWLAILSSVLIIKPLCRYLWFFSYHFIIWPVLYILPVLLAAGIFIPLVVYSLNNKLSIVEQLRNAE